MVYNVNDKVVIKSGGAHYVGIILEKRRLKKGWVYTAELENGKILENCSVNKELGDFIISRSLSKSFNKK